MDAAYHVEPWHDFAVMIGSATAALAGLLVVAMSINIREILSNSTLPHRAAGALIAMTTPLILAALMLVPDQPRAALAVEILAVGAAVGIVLPWLNRPQDLQQSTRQWLVGRATPIALIIVPLVVGGLGLLVTAVGGLYWLPVSILAAVVFGLVQAWVLLIEILR
jgi:modulator of FtsH protease